MSTSNVGNLQGSEGILFASVYFCITKTFSCSGGLQQSPCCEILTIRGTVEKENWREMSLLQVVGSPCEPSQNTDTQVPDMTTSHHSCCPAAAGAGYFARKEITSSPLVGFHLVCRWLWCDEKAPPLPKQFLIPLLYHQLLLPHCWSCPHFTGSKRLLDKSLSPAQAAGSVGRARIWLQQGDHKAFGLWSSSSTLPRKDFTELCSGPLIRLFPDVAQRGTVKEERRWWIWYFYKREKFVFWQLDCI